MFGSFGGVEVLIIIGVFFLLFGAKRLSELANALGKSKGEFQRGLNEATSTKLAETVADLEAGGMTASHSLGERAKAVGIDPVGMDVDELEKKVSALENLEKSEE